jgi:hypothetical protein
MKVSNEEFLQAIFGEHFIWAHVTDFFHDPGEGFTTESKIAWLGNHYINYQLKDYANQYFTVSLFKETSNGLARRRKELFQATYCIVIDDVGEKIPFDLMLDNVAPSWVLETSPGSQQWGYILSEPCDSRQVVENLLSGLVSELCPKGIDSGMMGVTRYVRLPEGYNTKASKIALNNNKPFKCNMIIWQPEVKIDINDLAGAFNVDLSKSSSYKTADDYACLNMEHIANHPAWKGLDIMEVVEGGRCDISCPWSHEHTDPSDDRASIFVLNDGYLAFKCHHGHCEKRTGADLVNHLSKIIPDWDRLYKQYRKEMILANPIKPCPIKFKEK